MSEAGRGISQPSVQMSMDTQAGPWRALPLPRLQREEAFLGGPIIHAGLHRMAGVNSGRKAQRRDLSRVSNCLL